MGAGRSDSPPSLSATAASRSPFRSRLSVLLVDELREAWRDEPRAYRFALGAMLAVAIALRLAHVGQPMRYDESVTYLYFVRLSWYDAVSLYTYPNNHVFHTLL